MRSLLDTHVALWAITNSARLSRRARDIVEDPSNAIFISVASVWEISIKYALRHRARNAMPISGAAALGFFKQAGYSMLTISAPHATAIDDLPALHGDPFDRILVAQALTEQMHLVTHDQALAAYDGSIIVV